MIATCNYHDGVASHEVTIGITRSGTFYPLGAFTVPVGAGQVAGTPAVDMLSPSVIAGLPVDNDGQPYVLLSDSTDLLQARVGASLTGSPAAELDFNTFGADF